MCLEILVRIDKDAAARISAKRLGQLVSLVVKSRTLDGEPALHLSVSGGCSCEFLSNEAPSDEPTWEPRMIISVGSERVDRFLPVS